MESTVRTNLMNEKGYTPYCGNDNCTCGMPRTMFNQNTKQFVCTCGWVSDFPLDFMSKYMKKWYGKNTNIEIAETCYQAIMNTTDIVVNSDDDEKMLICVIAATIEGVRKKQHTETTKSVINSYMEEKGLDIELLESVAMPDIDL